MIKNKQLSKENFSRILVFDPFKKLISIYHSLTSAANSYGVSNSSIHQACTGATISSCGHYFRFLSNDIELEWEDLGTLDLEEYDDMCGERRTYYPSSKMTRKGMRYTQQNKN